MLFIAVLVFVGTGLTVNSEKHSLTYIYTALSRPVDFPGIHEFTAMGLLDGRMIDYFDSKHQRKVPRQPWMAEKMNADYWEKGTQSRLSKQQWFKVNIDILKKRMNQTDDNSVRVLQWMHGCEGEPGPDGNLTFTEGKDMYSYDGDDFLSFDNTHAVWVAPTNEAVITKRKWDNVQVLKDYTRGYLQNECMEWLNKFMRYGEKQLKTSKPPKVFLLSKQAIVQTNVILTCLATGFYPKDIILEIIRDNRVVEPADGLMSSGVRPNHDETYQRRDSVEVPKTDVSIFKCVVIHKATNVSVEEVWKSILPEGDTGVTVGAVVGGLIGGRIGLLLVVGLIVLLVLYKRGIIEIRRCCSRLCSCTGSRNDGASPLVIRPIVRAVSCPAIVRSISISTLDTDSVGQNSSQEIRPIVRTNSCPTLGSKESVGRTSFDSGVSGTGSHTGSSTGSHTGSSTGSHTGSRTGSSTGSHTGSRTGSSSGSSNDAEQPLLSQSERGPEQV